nr:hypothetical protein [uncultured Flavobacterium sp.]
MGELRGRQGLEFARQIREDASQRNEGNSSKQKPEPKEFAIEVVDQRVHVISPDDAEEALKFARDGYKGNTESERDLN